MPRRRCMLSYASEGRKKQTHSGSVRRKIMTAVSNTIEWLTSDVKGEQFGASDALFPDAEELQNPRSNHSVYWVCCHFQIGGCHLRSVFIRVLRRCNKSANYQPNQPTMPRRTALCRPSRQQKSGNRCHFSAAWCKKTVPYSPQNSQKPCKKWVGGCWKS